MANTQLTSLKEYAQAILVAEDRESKLIFSIGDIVKSEDPEISIVGLFRTIREEYVSSVRKELKYGKMEALFSFRNFERESLLPTLREMVENDKIAETKILDQESKDQIGYLTRENMRLPGIEVKMGSFPLNLLTFFQKLTNIPADQSEQRSNILNDIAREPVMEEHKDLVENVISLYRDGIDEDAAYLPEIRSELTEALSEIASLSSN